MQPVHYSALCSSHAYCDTAIDPTPTAHSASGWNHHKSVSDEMAVITFSQNTRMLALSTDELVLLVHVTLEE